ncbi:SIR2 family protein [Candidatus Poriferisodalis sp.]|uniref:SIR2 family protein n=1 Tax=Candidatus Poriferisodalis sp. TaxID=3101277 RepID=UPI003B5BC482
MELLQSFDGRLQSVASGVARGEYVFWLGSGLSRSVVPDVGELLRKLLSYVQSRIDPADEACRFRKALREILEIAGKDLAQVPLTTSVDAWPQIDEIVQQLTGQYSLVFGVLVDDEDSDFLLWEGVDVVNTYGSPDLEPAAEHLCLAILMLEGVIRSAASANWDGLVERAIHRLTGEATGYLRVVVLPDEFSEPESRCDLLKFHGCAVKAREDLDAYRKALIAQHLQVLGWAAGSHNPVMKGHLEHLVATSNALVVGLSAQDANIQTILHNAAENLGRTWPVMPPAVVFALEDLKQAQRDVLRITYGQSFAEHRDEIEAAALLGAYAQPLLLALVLYILAGKLSSLVAVISSEVIDDATKEALQEGIRDLRDLVARAPDDDALGFVERLIAGVGIVLSMFRTGAPFDATDRRYDPLTAQPIEQTVLDPNVDTDALGYLAVAASLIGRGAAEHLWKLEPGDVDVPEEGAFTVESTSGNSHVFLVRDSSVLAQLEGHGHIDMSDGSVLAIHAKAIPPRQARSPKTRYGRTGWQPARQVAIETIAGDAPDFQALMGAFRQGADL